MNQKEERIIGKEEENYKLMNKLLLDKFGTDKVTIDELTNSTEVGCAFMCTAEIALAVAIAKRTNATCYLKNNKFILYTNTGRGVAHYLRWADDHIKREIKLIQDE